MLSGLQRFNRRPHCPGRLSARLDALRKTAKGSVFRINKRYFLTKKWISHLDDGLGNASVGFFGGNKVCLITPLPLKDHQS